MFETSEAGTSYVIDFFLKDLSLTAVNSNGIGKFPLVYQMNTMAIDSWKFRSFSEELQTFSAFI